ncbi:MAG: DUF58 domain-containing protein [Armatimonadota bacterium]|nr:DUF58 domain-containing protein [Armatimonadota bacterium]
MPTREGLVLLAIAAAIFLLATNVMSGLLFVLDAAVLGVIVVGTASALATPRRVRVRRQVPARGVEGTPLSVTLSVEARRLARLLVVEDGWPGGRVAAVVPAVLPGRPETVVLAPVPTRRGWHRVGPVEVRSRGALGVFLARRRLGEAADVLVWPALRPVAPAAVRRLAPVFEAAVATRRTRHPEDLYGVRDYRPGDALTRVHWPSSARRGALVVREFEQPEAPGLAIVLDLDARQPAVALDPAVRAAASLYRLARDRRVDVVLMAWTTGPVVLRQWEDAMDWLACTAPSGPPLAQALARLRAATDRHLVVVALTDEVAGWPEGCTLVAPANAAHAAIRAGPAHGALTGWPLTGRLTYAADGAVLG